MVRPKQAGGIQALIGNIDLINENIKYLKHQEADDKIMSAKLNKDITLKIKTLEGATTAETNETANDDQFHLDLQYLQIKLLL